VLNTDAEAYLGSGVGNLGGVTATAESWHGQPASTSLRVPPLGTVWLHSPGPGAGRTTTRATPDAGRRRC
jgi:1,4-alpha-glucan branching enzyme